MTLNARGLLIATLTACLAATAGTVRAEPLRIDRVDATNFANRNELVFFVDILDETTGEVVKGQDPAGDGIRFFFDDQEVKGEVRVETFKDANQVFAVAVLMAAHPDFAMEDPDPESKAPKVLKEQIEGFSSFFNDMASQNRVYAAFYTESQLVPITAWSSGPGQVPQRIRSMVKTDPPTGRYPDLYRHIMRVVESFSDDEMNQPERRLLVLMSDGLDELINPNLDERRLTANQKRIRNEMDKIVERAADLGIKIYVLAYTNFDERHLVNLQSLANRTGGIYRRLSADPEGPSISERIADLGRELSHQYVITLKPEGYRGSDKPVNIRLEVTTTANRRDLKAVRTGERIGERPTDIGAILVTVGIIVGSLLGVFLLFLLLRAFIRSRRNRKPAQVEEVQEFVGPYKGRLMATEGAYAGYEFYITEDVTTIGSLSGNTIVLAEGGVSKRHAGIKVEDMRFELADFGSTNGTYVNGAKITKQFLRDGDEIRLGDNKLRFTLK